MLGDLAAPISLGQPPGAQSWCQAQLTITKLCMACVRMGSRAGR
jgi:hypothetical protein